jgi:hypothetical protein
MGGSLCRERLATITRECESKSVCLSLAMCCLKCEGLCRCERLLCGEIRCELTGGLVGPGAGVGVHGCV